jgi:uncharacterized protein
MQYRRFGKTNLNLSVFSLGVMRCLASQAEAEATIRQALALGINHLETARGYGSSEQFIGETLSKGVGIPREKLYITTKIPPMPDAASMAVAIDESLVRLQLDCIDCLAIHGINTWEHLEWVKQPDGCLKVIREAMADGRIRHLGFSTHGSLELILATIATDLFEFINLHYYYFFQRNAPAITLAAQKDLGIFIISPADKGGRLYAPPEKLQQLCQPFSSLELTYRFLLVDRRITTLSVGAANPEELIEPLQVADRNEPLNSEEIVVFDRLETELSNSLQDDRCSQCYQCLPCPESINIPEVLRLRNLAVGCDMTEYGKYRYGMFENAGHWFVGTKANRCTSCGDCLPRCPENLDIPKLLFDTHELIGGVSRRRLWE